MNYNIPLFDLNFDAVEEKAVIETLRSKWISTGPKTQEFEDKFADMLGINYALATSNCTAALHLAMILAGVKKDDEVICPSLTFVATANAIKYVGAKPVFCDIKSYEDLTIDPDKLIKLINSQTKAIMVMHYAGFPCDMDRIMAIAKEKKLKVIEDACHGPLSEYNNKKLGTIGDIGCFSFFSNKNMSTGEGGMLVTDNENIYNKVKLLRSHGMTTLSYERSKGHGTSYDVVDLGYNYRMDDIRASIGLVQLKKLKKDLDKRSFIREQFIEELKGVNKIHIPFLKHKSFVSNYIFPIILKDSDSEFRDRMRKILAEKGIETSIHYSAIHQFSIYNHEKVLLPVTEYVSENAITLPMHGNLNTKDVKYICNSIKEVIN